MLNSLIDLHRTKSFLRPPALPYWHLLAFPFPRTITLRLPSPVLAQPFLGISGIVEVDLANHGLDQSPDTPVEARYASEVLYLVVQLVDVRLEVDIQGQGIVIRDRVVSERADVVFQEVPSLRLGGHEFVFAVKTGPFCEMVGYIERRRALKRNWVLAKCLGVKCTTLGQLVYLRAIKLVRAAFAS